MRRPSTYLANGPAVLATIGLAISIPGTKRAVGRESQDGEPNVTVC